ncbi:class I SAM-dependent methyltransferase [Tenuibacillus multivorans]|uniref:Methyltransferase domain-containing protein n=1 Tax=Tenuibacillus multivorans TaxID=237069 RepID=A0A1G9YML4_9BACI|nr:class I SAM-dependent methyltransferase [Tenuibacillus multivorans]GEL78474.1 hypothetical protein TMU01_27090 [Tenuibacillus multivorans]SDN10340.1 Methyltransferase domain-containing protein [Tenuibacillus multivorans]
MDYKSVEELHEFWKNPGKSNDPKLYLKKSKRSEYLYRFVNQYAETDAKIMEPGCNVGRNLHHLYENGYQNLTGIEINEEAVDLMQQHYADMAENIQVYNRSLENVLPKFKDHEFDLVVFNGCIRTYSYRQRLGLRTNCSNNEITFDCD